MTKLKNRTAFEKALDNINALRKETTFLLFDLNNMKQINDEFGHSVGDQVLIIIASVLKEVFEPEGVCYRIGGDEMCVLTGELPDEDMKKKIEQVRQLIDEAVKETGVNFSIAVGYARTKYSEGIGSSSAFNKADHLMYQCKKEMKTQA